MIERPPRCKFAAVLRRSRIFLTVRRTQEYRGQILIVSKITSKAQTTVPRSVRAALKLGVGDTIVYAIEGDHVVMTKATAAAVDSPTAAFDEWSSENDRHAYAGL
jgi:antitoxin PrlF